MQHPVDLGGVEWVGGHRYYPSGGVSGKKCVVNFSSKSIDVHYESNAEKWQTLCLTDSVTLLLVANLPDLR